jgi:hypothetical protein
MNNDTNMHTKTLINKNWNASSRKFDFSFTFAFKSKEQYLEFRRLWKQNYAALSRTIRNQKASIKTTMRKLEYVGKLQSEARNLSAEATAQLLMLSDARREANRQYLAAKQMAQ